MVIRLFHIVKDIVLVFHKHDRLAREEMLTGLGVWKEDSVSHVHVKRSDDAGRSATQDVD